MSSNKISIPDDELYRVRDILAQTAADKGSVTKEDIVQALAERDMKMDDHRLSYHIRMAEFTGTLCHITSAWPSLQARSVAEIYCR